jgi:hypothetical protein
MLEAVGASLGKEYLLMVQEGVIAAQYMGSWETRAKDAVLLAPQLAGDRRGELGVGGEAGGEVGGVGEGCPMQALITSSLGADSGVLSLQGDRPQDRRGDAPADAADTVTTIAVQRRCGGRQ